MTRRVRTEARAAFARMQLLGTLRARVTAIVLATVAFAFVGAGAVLVSAVERDARSGVDGDLEGRVASVIGPTGGAALRPLGKTKLRVPSAVTAKLARLPPDQRRRLKAKMTATAKSTPSAGGVKPLAKRNLLLGSGVFTRVIVNGQIVKQEGDIAGAPLPTSTGFQTVTVAGRPLRTLTTEQRGDTVEVAESLAPALSRAASTRRLVIVAGGIGLALTGLVVWFLTGLALRPLTRLRHGAERVSSTRDLGVRLAQDAGPAEIDALAHTLNAMLTRLAASTRETDQALAATRRFAADTGHEIRTPLTSAQANLEALRRNPEIPLDERRLIVEEVADEHRRLVALLDALQSLARGDASAHVSQEDFDLCELLDAAVHAARRRHPLLQLSLVECPESAKLRGWPEGVRSIIDNLLQNAAVHAGPRARIELGLVQRDGRLLLSVDDDGPGVPDAERQRIFDRFVRGEAASASGSGLGLAVVMQQVSLHRGEVAVTDSPLGGAKFEVWLHPATQLPSPRDSPRLRVPSVEAPGRD